ncbi:MAG: PEP/pyruvate-binding domain-containing protein [Polyangiaceae bacterium]
MIHGQGSRDRSALQEGWVIANHILVAFHVAFISSVLALPAASILKWEVLGFIFFSPETIVSALFTYLTFHFCVAWHELGHFTVAARLNALNESALREAQERSSAPFASRVLWYLGLFLKIPFGRAVGVKREGLNYYPDAPYNLAVAAAGPRASRNAALFTLPPAAALLAVGLLGDHTALIYAGRLLLGIGVVSFLDFRLADPGKYRAFLERERRAADKAQSVGQLTGWLAQAAGVKQRLLASRMQFAAHPRLGVVSAPWQFRNCGMGGRHTEKEYPESNVSMQEAMFLILSATSYQEAQELTVRLQNRLKEIIEKEEGCRVMGIGLEGGLAPYIEKGEFPLPEVRLWSMMKRAIAECGCRPGVDVAIALDPAMSELELAYRAENNLPDAVGMYLFWRDKAKVVLDRDGVLALFVEALEEYEIPILSIEDGFSEYDHEGWRLLRERLGDQVFIIGDDLVTTNDKTIEEAADGGLINCALIKANQIGSLYETLLAMLVALGKGLELVVSHRSKSPNDDMEAQIALAVNALGLKAGGGANTERLVKYQSVSELLLSLEEAEEDSALPDGAQAVIRSLRAYEEPTNAGIPTVGSSAEVWLPTASVSLRFRGATPLGTSAGSGEAIHLVDESVEYAEHKEVIDHFPALFRERELGVYAFKKGLEEVRVRSEGDDDLSGLFVRAQRYGGKGCLTAVENVSTVVAPWLEGKNVAELSLLDLDRGLLLLELRAARRRGKLAEDASDEECIRVMQRKQNIGMNALLSVSLAVGRAIARVHGKELYELLREEMLAVIDRLAARNGVELRGSRFVDYVTALRAVTAKIEQQGLSLHEVLRGLTGIYAESSAESAARRFVASAPPPGGEPEPEAAPEPVPVLVPAPESAPVPEPEPEREPVVGDENPTPAPRGRPVSEPLPTPSPLAAAAAEPPRARRAPPPPIAFEVLDRLAAELGDGYRKDSHHGLLHARDLLFRAELLAETLAVEERVDWRVLSAAIGLHDVASHKKKHGPEGAARAQQLLPKLPGFSDEQVKRVADAIVLHEDRTPDGVSKRQQSGLEAQILYDVDQLDAFGPKGVYRYVAVYTEREASLDRVLGDAEARYQSLAFDETRRLAAGDFGFTREFFERLAQEQPADDRMLGAHGVVRFISEHVKEPPHRLADEALDELSQDEEASPERAFAVEYFRALRGAYAELAAGPADPNDAGAEAEAESSALLDVDRALWVALVQPEVPEVQHALDTYLQVKALLGRPERPFGIVNNRVLRAGSELVVPYLLGRELVIHVVGEDGPVRTVRRALPPGTIFTDALVGELAEVRGEAIDLEKPLYVLDPDATPVMPIVRIRDAAALLERVNSTTNRNQAVFLLRTLAARLSHLSVKDLLGAKNLQPEIRDLTKELVRFLNGPLRRRLLVLTRLIVRNLSGLVGKPNVIDRLWNDTIELAEIRVPGSAVVNELRRTCHHALGKRSLHIAIAYREFLDSGDTKGLAALGFGAPSQADLDARGKEAPREILRRVEEDLGRLLGASQIVTRVEEWKESYADALLRCDLGTSVEEELTAIVDKGLREKNRWVYYHHLRILGAKAQSFWWPQEFGKELSESVELASRQKPDAEGFDAADTEQALRDAVAEFVRELRAHHQDELFGLLSEVIASYQDEQYFETFRKTRALRAYLVGAINHAAFEEQRYYLCQLETLLEEMGYLAIRHVASHYQEKGVDLEQCLELVRLTAMNLQFDGLFSRELSDFATMLVDGERSEAELLNLLESVERAYHRVRQRVTVPYEKMRERLGHSPQDLRQILANIQRYMHDLNSMVQFADTAASHLREQLAQGRALRSSRPAPSAEAVEEAILHISHRERIRRFLQDDSAHHSLREIYGGKGSGLCYISYLNVPTRDGFILPTSYGRAQMHRVAPERLRRELSAHLAELEADISRRDGEERRFGVATGRPLVLAVRGGSVLSMPGILTTVVFLGMNDEIVEQLATDMPWGAWDSYRRFLASYADAVWGFDLEQHDLVEKAKQRHGVRYKHELPWQAMRDVAEESKRVLRDAGFGKQLDAVLADPFAQLEGAVGAVFNSWDTETAQRFREIKGICHSWHTAAIVQEMAFGNRVNARVAPGLDETEASLTGVITRTYPTDTGVRAFEGEVKFSAAGDDLVSGITFSGSFRGIDELGSLMPMLDNRLKHNVAKIRRFMGTDQEVEFTVDHGVLSVLQTRRAEAHKDQATDRFLEPGEPATRGVGVRGGGFRGIVVFDDADLAELSKIDFSTRDDVDGLLLVIENPTPDDIPLIISAGGLLTARGGSTSHAAVAINGIEDRDYSGVVSAVSLDVNASRHEAVIRAADGQVLHRIRKGDIVSIHGTTGEVYVGSRRKLVAKP